MKSETQPEKATPSEQDLARCLDADRDFDPSRQKPVSLPERLGDALDHGRMDDNHRPAQ